jgi:hypothetical protein
MGLVKASVKGLRVMGFPSLRKEFVMESVREWLSEQFWSGKRFVVFAGGMRLKDRPACYTNFSDAGEYCRSSRVPNSRIGILSSVLKAWSGKYDLVSTQAEKETLKAVLSRYPLRLFFPTVDCRDELLKGNYYPMVWEKGVDPLQTIRQYLVLWLPNSGPMKCRVLCTTARILVAMRRFGEEVSHPGERDGVLMLVGRFVDTPYRHRAADMEDSQSSLIFYRLLQKPGDPLVFTEVNDPALPVVRHFPVFVRYHPKRPSLSFYDGSLKWIRPGDEPDGIELQFFDFGPAPDIKSHGNEKTRRVDDDTA